MTSTYIIQKNQDTTQAAGPCCHSIVTGDGLVDSDCPGWPHDEPHASYTNPVWQVKGCLVPDAEDVDNYYFGPVDFQMTVPKADCYLTEADARAECASRNG